jgi:hypothetical protein
MSRLFFHAQNRVGAARIPTSGLLAYWDFNSSIQKTSGSVSVTSTDSSSTSVAGKYGNGRAFLHTPSVTKITTDNSVIPTTGAFTIGLWLYRQRSGALQFFCGVLDSNQAGNQSGMIINSSDQFIGRVRNSAGTLDDIGGSLAPSALNTWEHWVYCCADNGGTHRLYKNGSQVATVTSTVARSGALATNFGFNNDSNFFASCILDEVAVYNRELSAAEVVGLMNGTQV